MPVPLWPRSEPPHLPFITILAAATDNLAILAANFLYHPYKREQTREKDPQKTKAPNVPGRKPDGATPGIS
jgi:hypothetical protein